MINCHYGTGRLGNKFCRNIIGFLFCLNNNKFKCYYDNKEIFYELGFDFLKKFDCCDNNNFTYSKLYDKDVDLILNKQPLNENLNYIFNSHCQTEICSREMQLLFKNKVYQKNIIDKNKFKERYNNNDDLFIHVRLGDIFKKTRKLGPSCLPNNKYYKNMIRNKVYKNGYISTDSPDNKFIKDLIKEFNLILINYNEVETIMFASTCKHIILSTGTFSYIIGTLAFFSEEIIYPDPSKFREINGPIYKSTNWTKDIYTYIDKSNNKIYPLSMSIPDEIFKETSKNKINKIFIKSPLIPGIKSTYIYNTENEYYKMYFDSKFGITHKKGGYECMRHYEILANSCIPLFDDLKTFPQSIMTNFPKKLIIDVNKKFKNNKLSDEEYFLYMKKIFDYSKKHLSCSATANYFLKKINYNFNKNNKILFLMCQTKKNHLNYTRETLFIGLRKILGNKIIDYPKKNFLYKKNKETLLLNNDDLYGKGYTYSERLEDININRNDIENRILNNEFSFIIYGNVGFGWCQNDKQLGTGDARKNLIFWHLIKNNYSKNQIVFIYGSDKPSNTGREKLHLNYHSQFGICFVRELII